jgi:hypothetical protein
MSHAGPPKSWRGHSAWLYAAVPSAWHRPQWFGSPREIAAGEQAALGSRRKEHVDLLDEVLMLIQP